MANMINNQRDDQWRIVPAILPKNATTRDLRFRGLTELRRNGRTFACVGTGPDVEAALRQRAPHPLPDSMKDQG